jgi:hypothetical protein
MQPSISEFLKMLVWILCRLVSNIVSRVGCLWLGIGRLWVIAHPPWLKGLATDSAA